MKIKTFLYAVIVIASGTLGDASLAQSAPQQSGSLYAASVTHSGRARNPESIKRAKLTRLKKDVGLNDQQVQSVMPIIDTYVTAVQNVKNDASIDSHTKRSKLAELRKRYDTDIDAILTPEQQQKLASIKAERRARLRGARAASETSQPAEAPNPSTKSAAVQ
jgi:Spy/CpxP family protein refolding chaperone